MVIPGSKRVTIDDIAELAGVHPSTVSRALRPGSTLIKSETASRIRALADEHGYIPDRNAASLRTQRTGTIGVVVPRLSDHLMALFYEAVAAKCHDRDYVALVATTNDDPDGERRASEALLARRVDGLVLTTARLNDSYLNELESREVPFVLALRRDGNHPFAINDDVEGGRLAALHLIELGHRRIGMVAGPEYATNALGRRQGFEQAHHEAGVPLYSGLIHPSRFRWDDGFLFAKEMLRSKNPPSAIFAVNDEAALGVLAAAQSLDISVPEELSIVGYNDLPSAARPPIPLTTVKINLAEVAKRSVSMTFERIRRRRAKNWTGSVTLEVRASSAPPKANLK